MPTPIILLCGAAGSGKDTISQMISKYASTISIAQADPLKRLGNRVFDFNQKQLYGPSECRNTDDKRYSWKMNGTEGWAAAWDRLKKYGPDWTKEIFGDYYNMAYNALEVWFSDLQDDMEAEQKTLTPRTMLQSLGTEYGRSIDPNIWSSAAINTAQKLLCGGWDYSPILGLVASPEIQPEFVIVTDGRFKNEVLNMSKVGGTTVLITSPEVNTAVETAGIANHPSETQLKTIPSHWFNYHIHNDKKRGLLYLENNVQRLVQRLEYGCEGIE